MASEHDTPKEDKPEQDKNVIDYSVFKSIYQNIEESDQSVFITGKAGTGKSTFLQYFVEKTTKNVAVVAPTGVAAINVKGRTIHNFFHFYIDVTPQKIIDGEVKPRNPKLYENLQALVIDEISMVRADLMDCIHEFLTRFGPYPGELFGGVQLIIFGDLYQLPPVVTNKERDIFSQHYKTPYFFSAHCFTESTLHIIQLDTVFRQKDEQFVQLLNAVRDNTLSDYGLNYLNQRYDPDFEAKDDIVYIYLTTTNRRATEVNQSHLDALESDNSVSHGEIKGDFSNEYLPTDIDLEYKVGAQIMLLNNDSFKRWVNGTIGVIEGEGIDEDDEPYIRIFLPQRNKRIRLKAHTWEMYDFKIENNKIVSEPVGSFTQYPFRMAWAVTIHKSQGKTFDNVVLDLDRGAFASGQLYVALSRCTTLEGLVLKQPVRYRDIRSDKRVDHFFREFLPVTTKSLLSESA